jgi:hypothetical protein
MNCATHLLDGQLVDVLDLKTLLITRGINVPDDIVARFGQTHRLAPTSHPFACNCLLLPGGVPAHLFHIGPAAEFSLSVNDAGQPCLTHRGRRVTPVDFPPATRFYERVTRSGFPYQLMAVLQGLDVISFPYLWPCQFALGGTPCHFCYHGNITLAMKQAGQPLPPNPRPADVAEAVAYAVREEGCRDVQLTGGSEVDAGRGELPLATEVLAAIEQKLGLANIPGEIYLYTSAPKDPAAVDEVFAAGADRVAYDLNVWDETIFAQVCPGIAQHIGRAQQLRAIEYAARQHGPNKVCSAFVVGLEPVESLLAGAEWAAQRGVVPLFSIWMPHGRPVLGSTTPPGLDYYRRARQGFLELFAQYQLTPPGASGLNVCLCRDLVSMRSNSDAQTSACRLNAAGKWAGRWEGSGGHGGTLSCFTTQTGPQTWAAHFTAECGSSHEYTVQLVGKPENPLPGSEPAVRFEGEVDLGPNGIFIWTGRATSIEFSGQYQGDGVSGTFRMTRGSEVLG